MACNPNPDQLKNLTFVEKLNFRFMHALNQTPGIRNLLTKIQATLGKKWVELATGNIVEGHGFENFEKIDPAKGVFVVVNHRTFYDQFVVAWKLFCLFGAHHNIYFPVRATFFYDNPLGLFVNIPLTYGAMYPPIIRDKKRRYWNLYATELMIDLLRDSRNMIGFHPEGTRNRGPDPYTFLRAKPGAGEIVYHARPNVIPVFLQGFPRTIPDVVKQNYRQKPSDPPLVHMVMGEPMDFTEELKLPKGNKTYLLISRKIMQRIAELSEQERAIRKSYSAA